MQILFHYLFLHLQCILIEICMDIKSLLGEIELSVKELKYLVASFAIDQNDQELKDVLQRKINTTQQRLDEMKALVEGDEQPIPVMQTTPLNIAETPETVIEDDSAEDECSVIEEAVADDIAEEKIEKDKVLDEEIAVAAEEEGEPLTEELAIDHSEVIKEIAIEPSTVIGERVYLSGDLRKSISLNDSFRFLRDIFGGDNELMNRILDQISEISSYESALAFLSSKIELDEEDDTTAYFLSMLQKYFN